MHDLSCGYNGFSANHVADVATACSLLGLERFPAWITGQASYLSSRGPLSWLFHS